MSFFDFKWKKVEATSNVIPTPRPKDSVQTKLENKAISLEVQRRHSRSLQRLINKGQHRAQPVHCTARLRKLRPLKFFYSSTTWLRLSGAKR